MPLEKSGSSRAPAFHVLESCGKFVASNRCQPHVDSGCDFMGRGKRKKKAISADQNEQKEALDDRLSSPISQGSNAHKLLGQSVPDVSNLRPYKQKKPKWKDSCFIKLSEEELAMPKDIKSDPRPLLRYHINCLLLAAGWLIGRRRRNNSYNGIGEYVYKSPGGRPIREFHRAWRMCGESLLIDTIFSTETNENLQWADMSELWSDLSNTVKIIEQDFSVLVTASSMARLWCILDPYVNVVFIEKTIRLLKKGIAVNAKRTLVISSNAGPAAKYRKVSGSGRRRINPRLLQDWELNEKNHYSFRISDVQVESRLNQIIGSHEAVCANEGSRACSPSSEQTESTDNIEFSWSRRVHNKSRKISEMKLNHFTDGSFTARQISSSRCPSKRSKLCNLRDDDLLISALVKSKNPRATKKRSNHKLKPPGKRKGPKGSCRLLRSFKNGGKHVIEGKWSLIESRTVLSWLIHCNVVSLNDVIQYRDLDDGIVLKDGVITRDGILCYCCHKVLSISEFKFHAGFQSNRPCMNLFVKSNKSIILCQLEAWLPEFRARQMSPRISPADAVDHNDDSCGCCGDVGELLCCDNCPSAFHLRCLFQQELPDGSWYCPQCCCQICGDVVIDMGTSEFPCGLKCPQCENKYHKTCVEQKYEKIGLPSATWFCGDGCHKVYTGLESQIGLKNFIADGFSWSLLRCISCDNKAQSSPHAVALEAECNSKLAVAITILEECFLPMVDARTGISMIPQVIFNLGSQFARLDYSGFYTVVLEEDDAIMCVASIRIHGTEVAELPLIATCSRNRRRGMCRRLINSIEEMLVSLNIKKLVLSAIPELLETWIVGFGFEPLDEEEKRSLSVMNLMVFPCSVWVKKTLNRGMAERNGSCHGTISDTGEPGAEELDHQSVREHQPIDDARYHQDQVYMMQENHKPCFLHEAKPLSWHFTTEEQQSIDASNGYVEGNLEYQNQVSLIQKNHDPEPSSKHHHQEDGHDAEREEMALQDQTHEGSDDGKQADQPNEAIAGDSRCKDSVLADVDVSVFQPEEGIHAERQNAVVFQRRG